MFHNKKLILTAICISFLTVSAVGAENTANDSIKIKINGSTFDVKLENNSACEELVKSLKKNNISINASDYGNFEKVGDLGFSLPTNDKNINTSPGDIVLYQGDMISIFYDSHSWSYTRLGKIQGVDSEELKEVLGSGNVTVEFFLK